MKKIVLLLTLAGSYLILLPTPAAGQVFEVYNLNPVIQIYGLPRARSQALTPSGETALDFKVDVATHFVNEDETDESVLFDGETHLVSLVARRGFWDGWEANLEIPFIRQTPGRLDSIVNEYHDITSLNDGGRDDFPDDRLSYRYQRDGQMLLDFNERSNGLGDVRLGVARKFDDLFEQAGAALHAQVKLPTGDADELSGSDAADLAVWGVVGTRDTDPSRWRFNLGGGAIYSGEGDVLSGLRQEFGGFGWGAAAFRITPNLSAIAQAYLNSSFYEDSDIDAIDALAVIGTFGLEWRPSATSHIQVSFSEDLVENSAPDIAFHLSGGWRY